MIRDYYKGYYGDTRSQGLEGLSLGYIEIMENQSDQTLEHEVETSI